MITLVSPGFRYTLAITPVKNTDPNWDVVRRPLLLAKNVVRIDCVLLDREFYDMEVYQMVRGHGLGVYRPCEKKQEHDQSLLQGCARRREVCLYTVNRALSTRVEIEMYFKDGDMEDGYDFMVVGLFTKKFTRMNMKKW